MPPEPIGPEPPTQKVIPKPLATTRTGPEANTAQTNLGASDTNLNYIRTATHMQQDSRQITPSRRSDRRRRPW